MGLTSAAHHGRSVAALRAASAAADAAYVQAAAECRAVEAAHPELTFAARDIRDRAFHVSLAAAVGAGDARQALALADEAELAVPESDPRRPELAAAELADEAELPRPGRRV